MTKRDNSEPENFLARWSARKLADRKTPTRQEAASEQARDDETRAAEDSAAAEPGKDRPFDLAQLPPLDSIGADTNVADFLRREVPPELARAALRRAWTSDPAIKNFIGPVENGWDFNDPSAMGGFGPISAEEVARLAGKVIEALPGQAKEQPASESTSQIGGADVPPEIAAKTADETTADETTEKIESEAADKRAVSDGNDAPQQNKSANKG
jgi:hypothetical protein